MSKPLFHLSLFILFFMISCKPTLPAKHRKYILKHAITDMQCSKNKLQIKFLRETKKENKLYKVMGCGAVSEYLIVCNVKNICDAKLVRVPVPVDSYKEDKTNFTELNTKSTAPKKEIHQKQSGQPKKTSKPEVLDEEEAPL